MDVVDSDLWIMKGFYQAYEMDAIQKTERNRMYLYGATLQLIKDELKRRNLIEH